MGIQIVSLSNWVCKLPHGSKLFIDRIVKSPRSPPQGTTTVGLSGTLLEFLYARICLGMITRYKKIKQNAVHQDLYLALSLINATSWRSFHIDVKVPLLFPAA